MANLNLTGQTAKADQLRPILIQWRTELEKRYAVWQRLSPAKRRQWIQAAQEKDPLFDLFVSIVQYSKKWEVDDNG